MTESFRFHRCFSRQSAQRTLVGNVLAHLWAWAPGGRCPDSEVKRLVIRTADIPIAAGARQGHAGRKSMGSALRLATYPALRHFSKEVLTAEEVGRGPCQKKMSENAERSRYVYENTRNMDKMDAEESDNFGSLEPNRLTFPPDQGGFDTKMVTSLANRRQRRASCGEKPAIIIGFSHIVLRHPVGRQGAG